MSQLLLLHSLLSEVVRVDVGLRYVDVLLLVVVVVRAVVGVLLAYLVGVDLLVVFLLDAVLLSILVVVVLFNVGHEFSCRCCRQ